MARQTGSFQMASNLEMRVSAPLDARLVVSTKTELYDYDFSYRGMPVAVTDENALYLLIGADPSLETSWRKIGEDNSVELTQAEYDALTPAEKSNGVVYYVTDGDGSGSGGSSYDDTELRNRIAALEAKLADFEEFRLQMTDGTTTVDNVVLAKPYVEPTPPASSMFDLETGFYDVNGNRIGALSDYGEYWDGRISESNEDGTNYNIDDIDASDIPPEVKGLVLPNSYGFLGWGGPVIINAPDGLLDWVVIPDIDYTYGGEYDPYDYDITDNPNAVGTIYYRASTGLTRSPWGQTGATIDGVGEFPWA